MMITTVCGLQINVTLLKGGVQGILYYFCFYAFGSLGYTLLNKLRYKKGCSKMILKTAKVQKLYILNFYTVYNFLYYK